MSRPRIMADIDESRSDCPFGGKNRWYWKRFALLLTLVSFVAMPSIAPYLGRHATPKSFGRLTGDPNRKVFLGRDWSQGPRAAPLPVKPGGQGHITSRASSKRTKKVHVGMGFDLRSLARPDATASAA